MALACTKELTGNQEAYNGEYTIEEVLAMAEPSRMDAVEAQATYTAMMTDTLLEG